jgi:hypothetical protein
VCTYHFTLTFVGRAYVLSVETFARNSLDFTNNQNKFPIMGNVPPHGFSLPTQVGRVTVSTRSDPLGGFAVQREVGIVFGNSRAYNSREQGAGPQTHLAEAVNMMVAEAEKLGANAVLSVHVEVKEYGQNFSICQVYGTACQVGPR